jgi:drug/metabolite transporter (DMT)-like permease
LAVGATIILWASAFPAIRAGLESFSPLALAALRFAAASAVLAVIAPLAGIGLPAGADWPRVLLAGAVGIAGYNILLNYGQTTVAAGPAAFLINTHPIIAALLGTAFLGERLRPWGWIGIAISFAGVGVIAMERSGGALALERGTIFVLAAAFCFALHFVIQKPLLTRYSALQVATWMIWSGTALLTPFLPQALESVSAASPRSLGATVFLAVGPAVLAYFAWAYALARFPVSRAAAFLYLVVPTTLVIAYLWLGEVPTAGTLGGGALALSGVIVVNTLGRAPRR